MIGLHLCNISAILRLLHILYGHDFGRITQERLDASPCCPGGVLTTDYKGRPAGVCWIDSLGWTCFSYLYVNFTLTGAFCQVIWLQSYFRQKALAVYDTHQGSCLLFLPPCDYRVCFFFPWLRGEHRLKGLHGGCFDLLCSQHNIITAFLLHLGWALGYFEQVTGSMILFLIFPSFRCIDTMGQFYRSLRGICSLEPHLFEENERTMQHGRQSFSDYD